MLIVRTVQADKQPRLVAYNDLNHEGLFTMALPFKTWATEKQFGLARTPNLKLILWYHDRIEIDTEFEVMAVTPQTPKCQHNLGCASVVVTFGSLWCHSHDLKLGINSFN